MKRLNFQNPVREFLNTNTIKDLFSAKKKKSKKLLNFILIARKMEVECKFRLIEFASVKDRRQVFNAYSCCVTKILNVDYSSVLTIIGEHLDKMSDRDVKGIVFQGQYIN
jgi:hypothetical protein